MRRTAFVLTILLAAAFLLTLSRCASRPIVPDTSDVKVSRENPKSECKDLGRVTGTTSKINARPEDALADMKDEAAKKGANYVQVGEYSSTGGSVVGFAFSCP